MLTVVLSLLILPGYPRFPPCIVTIYCAGYDPFGRCVHNYACRRSASEAEALINIIFKTRHTRLETLLIGPLLHVSMMSQCQYVVT